jgi:hypothetical protein
MKHIVHVRPQARVDDSNPSQFQPTILITDNVRDQLKTGALKLRTGQWIIDGRTGVQGQVITTAKKSLKVRLKAPNKPFSFYQKSLVA